MNGAENNFQNYRITVNSAVNWRIYSTTPLGGLFFLLRAAIAVAQLSSFAIQILDSLENMRHSKS